MRRLLPGLVSVSLLLSATAWAELKWDRTRLEFHPAVGDQDVKAEFSFTNGGQAPVSIDSVTPGCGCTTAVLEKPTYLPGERGRILVTFHIGERTGVQLKTIRVAIHGEKDPVFLTIVTYVPDAMHMEPRYIFWREGDAPNPHSIKVTAPADASVHILHVNSSNPKFQVAVRPVQPGSVYLLVVTPTDTATDMNAVFEIAALTKAAAGAPQSAPPALKIYKAFASITPK